MSLTSKFLILLALIAASTPAAAKDSDVPYWASIRAEKVHMRVGPSTSYNIDWVYKRVGLPVRVIRRKEGWRLVEDPDGAKGWMLGRFLSRDRSAIVIGTKDVAIMDKSEADAQVLWRLAPGVTGMLGDCEAGWCEMDVAGRRGLVRQENLWGPGGA